MNMAGIDIRQGFRSACFVGLIFLLPLAAPAQCIAVVDVAQELPHQVRTPAGTHLLYFYNLELETYLVIVSRDGFDSPPNGPYHLSLACLPAMPRWESDDFVLLEGGCGTFCWYVDVIPVSLEPEPVRVDRPLAFDAGSNLLAYYADKDLIHVRNLVSGVEQAIQTAHVCESASGLCFEDTEIDNGQLSYTWRLNPAEARFEVDLDTGLLLESTEAPGR